MNKWLILSAFATLLLVGCASPPPPRTVHSVDLKRYLGEWHEIARYPNWFQRNCANHVTATYAPNADGSISVVNSCVSLKGKTETAKGRATVVPGSGNAKLKVSFAPPFKGDYWILAVDKNYQWALVGHPSRNYLWILARDSKISPALYSKIVQLAVDQGYDASRIQLTPP